MKRPITIVLVGLLTALTVSADVPDLLNYQGYLTDPGGTALTGDLDMVFSLWTADSGGSKQWSETWNTGTSQVTVTDGYYAVLLGSHESLGTVFEDDDVLYLQVEIGGEALTPRKRVVSTAFGKRAGTADSVEWDGIESMPAGFADGVDDGDVSLAQYRAALLQWYHSTYSVGTHPRDVAFDGENIWVVSSFDDTVTKLN